MTIREKQEEIIGEFEFLDNWEDKYQFIIDLGKELDEYPDAFRNDEHLVKGCQSRVWLHWEKENGHIRFYGDSDGLIPKGLISLLLSVYNGRTPAEIAGEDLYFIDRIGLSQNLSPTRSNGLFSMVKKIQQVAREL